MARIYSEEDVLNDPAISFWLKEQIKKTKNRDVLDSLRDAELLVSLLEQRCINAGCIIKQ